MLEDSETVAELVEAHRAYLEGDVVRGFDAVKGAPDRVSAARYEPVVTSPAARAISETLPEAVAFAVIDLQHRCATGQPETSWSSPAE